MPLPTASKNQSILQSTNLNADGGARRQLSELESMLDKFRVKELKKVLAYLELPKYGLKERLKSNVLAALRNNEELVGPKIEEIYNEFMNEINGTNRSNQPQANVQINADLLDNNANDPKFESNVPNGIADVPAVETFPKESNKNNPLSMSCLPNIVKESNTNQEIPVVRRLDVRFKKLQFYDVLDTLVQPSSLGRGNMSTFAFTLTPNNLNRIKLNTAVQVLLRFCLNETSCEQEDAFPKDLHMVRVNNYICPLPPMIVEKKFQRPSGPLNITQFVKLSAIGVNPIKIMHSDSNNHCVGVFLVEKLTTNNLLNSLKSKVKPADYTRGLIKEKLTEGTDTEIVTTMLKVSLNCPLGKARMSLPCRAVTCFHVQCFDAALFLQMNERKSTWNCPVCNKSAEYETLVIDGYFQEVLVSPLLQPDDTEVQLNKDGSWSRHSPCDDIENLELSNNSVDKTVKVKTHDHTVAKAKPKKSTPNLQPITSATVDLTVSDSDDDLILVK